jgi:hypothetical protein
MPKKPSKKVKTNQEKAVSPLEKEVIKIIEKHDKNLTKKDIKDIIETAMPNLDRLIANKVKEHFTVIAEHIQETFKIYKK